MTGQDAGRRAAKAWRPQFWTFWTDETICSKHTTFAAAARAVKACEKREGAKHAIYRVEKMR